MRLLLTSNDEGRPASWQNAQSSPNQRARYLSDGAGQRVQQVATSSGATTTTAYYGGLAESVNGTVSYLLSDGLGSVSEAVSTSTGAVSATQLYGPYGTVRYQSGTLPTDHGYTGQVSDAATSGLDYYGARYYDPVAGQFTSADTTLAGGLNEYACAGGNPETKTDPTGHCPSCIFGAIVGAAAMVAVAVVAEQQTGQLTSIGGIMRVGADAALGASAGFLIGSGNVGAIVGAAGAVIGVGAQHAGGEQFTMQSMQSDLEAVAIGADVGALGGALGSSIDGMATTAGAKVVTQMAVQGVLAAGAEGATETANQLDVSINQHRLPRYDLTMIAVAFGTAAVAAGLGQLLSSNIRVYTNRQLGPARAGASRVGRTNFVSTWTGGVQGASYAVAALANQQSSGSGEMDISGTWGYAMHGRAI